jgi:hypothetical protein
MKNSFQLSIWKPQAGWGSGEVEDIMQGARLTVLVVFTSLTKRMLP